MQYLLRGKKKPLFLVTCQIRGVLGKNRLREIREGDVTFQKQKTLKAGGRARSPSRCRAGLQQTQSDGITKTVKVIPNLDAIDTIGSNWMVVNIVSYIMKSFLESLITATTVQYEGIG